MAIKEIELVIEASGQTRRVTLSPGMDVATTLRAAGLDPEDVFLEAPDSTKLLAPSEDLYSIVDPGEKLVVCPQMEAGKVFPQTRGIGECEAMPLSCLGFVFFLASSMREPASPGELLFGGLFLLGIVVFVLRSQQGGRRPAAVTGASSGSGPRDRKQDQVTTERWLRRNGWTRDGRSYNGRFRTGFDTFVGRVEARNGGFEVYVRNPPRWLVTGRHSECVHPRGGGWFWIHQSRHHQTLRGAIRSVEGFLLEKYAEHQGAL